MRHHHWHLGHSELKETNTSRHLRRHKLLGKQRTEQETGCVDEVEGVINSDICTVERASYNDQALTEGQNQN